MHAGAVRRYSESLACAPCMIEVARGCAQLARCSLQCSGYHTALAAAAAAVWIAMPAAELHARFQKPLAVFVRLVVKCLFALGFTADEEVGERWPLRRLVDGMHSSRVPCITSMHVPTDQYASTVR